MTSFHMFAPSKHCEIFTIETSYLKWRKHEEILSIILMKKGISKCTFRYLFKGSTTTQLPKEMITPNHYLSRKTKKVNTTCALRIWLKTKFSSPKECSKMSKMLVHHFHVVWLLLPAPIWLPKCTTATVETCSMVLSSKTAFRVKNRDIHANSLEVKMQTAQH